MRDDHPNLVLVRTAARALGPLRDRFVFLGGAATNLLITDPAAPMVRATRDVDVIVEVASTIEYLRLEDELRRLGLAPDESPGAPRCRWVVDDVLLDVMPTEEAVLGFANRWYPAACRTAQPRSVGGGLAIRVVTPPLFLATKLEAFRGRGQGDLFASRDIEDVIAVVDGREELAGEVGTADREVRSFLAEEFGALLEQREFRSAIAAQLPPDAISQARADIIWRRLEAISRSSRG